jgi:hypothetical protein
VSSNGSVPTISKQGEVLVHDWTILEICIDWAVNSAELVVLDERSLRRSIIFNGLCELSADRREHWGPSNSINEVSWDVGQGECGVCLKIEMQSGGMISISAAVAEMDGVPYR